MSVAIVHHYLNILKNVNGTIRAMQVNVDIVRAILPADIPTPDPYQFMMLMGYPTYITDDNKGHYFSAYATFPDWRSFELIVSHRVEFAAGLYQIKGL